MPFNHGKDCATTIRLVALLALASCAGLAPRPTPKELVAQALNCKPKAGATCSTGDGHLGDLENQFPWPEVLSAKVQEDGNIRALVLRHPDPGQWSEDAAFLTERGAIFEYLVAKDGRVTSRRCVSGGLNEDAGLVERGPPMGKWFGNPVFRDPCGYRLTPQFDHCVFSMGGRDCQQVVTNTWVHDHFPLQEVAIPAEDASVRTVQGRGYRAYPEVAAHLHLLGDGMPFCEKSPTDRRIAEMAKQGKTEIEDLRPGHEIQGRVVFLEAGASLEVDVGGIILHFATPENSGAAIHFDVDGTLTGSWAALRKYLGPRQATERIIWISPYALVGEELIKLSPAGVRRACASLTTTELCRGRCNFLTSDITGPPGQSALYSNNTLVFSWSGQVRGGRCLVR